MRFRPPSSTLFLISLLLVFPASAQSGHSGAIGADSSAIEHEIISVARDRANSLTSGDCQKWASYVAGDFQDIEAFATESRDTILKECRQSAQSASACKTERSLSDFHFRFAGNLVFVDYVYTITDHCGDNTFVAPHRQVDTYEKRKDKWIALFCVEVLQAQDPPVAKIDTAILDEYTGQYAWAGSRMVDTVTRKGDKLYIQTTGDDTPTEIVAQGADTFFVRGSLNRSTFVRDSSGRVVESRGYSADNGQGYHARKIK